MFPATPRQTPLFAIVPLPLCYFDRSVVAARGHAQRCAATLQRPTDAGDRRRVRSYEADSRKIGRPSSNSVLRPQIPASGFDVGGDLSCLHRRDLADRNCVPEDVNGVHHATRSKGWSPTREVKCAVVIRRKFSAGLFCEVDGLGLAEVGGRRLATFVQPHLQPVDRSELFGIWGGGWAKPSFCQDGRAVRLTSASRGCYLLPDLFRPSRFRLVTVLPFEHPHRPACRKVSEGHRIVEYWWHRKTLALHGIRVKTTERLFGRVQR